MPGEKPVSVAVVVFAAIGALAKQSGWSHKHFVAQFTEHIGLPPKAMARVRELWEAVGMRVDVLARTSPDSWGETDRAALLQVVPAQLDVDGLGRAQQGHGEQRPDEGCGAEMRCGPRRAEVTQRVDEEHQARAVPEETERKCACGGSGGGQHPSQREAENEIEAAGDNSLDQGDGDGIGARHLAREIVVDRPAQARAYDRQRIRRECERRTGLVREHEAAGEHDECGRPDAAADRLAKEQGGDESGNHALEI